MRVLVVDYEALIVVLTASWLEDLGCEVETAFNGSQLSPKFGMIGTSRC
jgi:CheY-like chemotaxis protein